MSFASDPWILVLAGTLGTAAAGVAWLGTRLALATEGRQGPTHGPLPVWLRLTLPPAAALARGLAPLMRQQWMAGACKGLRAADLDDAILPGEWLALPLLLAVAGAVLALALGGGRTGVALVAGAAALWPVLWLRNRRRLIIRDIDRELPRLLELLTLAVEAGCALGAALRIGAESGSPGSLQRGLDEALRAVRAGRTRSEALTALMHRYGHAGLDALLGAIMHAEASGAGIAATLRAQVTQRTDERFARAEKLAMQSPVKMLGPLILCIFPCAFLVIGFPIAHRLMQWM